MDFSIELAQDLLNSPEDFPVSLDEAWIWLGYSRKDKALDTLKSYFESGVDFSTERGKSTTGGRPSDFYYLTTNCLKEFGMIARTEQGKLIRKYFLECEKIAKQAVTSVPQPKPPKLGTSVEATIATISPFRTLLTTLPAALVDGFLLNEVQKLHPEVKPIVNAAHSLLASNTKTQEVLLTPTAIGERLGVSARVVNAVLTDNGYQVKNLSKSKSKTEPAYLPTDRGKAYSCNTLATGRSTDNTSYQHTKWAESIVKIVRDLM